LSVTDDGVASYTIKGSDNTGNIDETVTVQHNNMCDDYEKGTVEGFYFGGTCTAPVDVTAEYKGVR